MTAVARRAAVCGKPIAHSLSPVIHTAGYAAAGLLNWTYTAVECAESELADFVAGLGPEWAGLSLTMPLKEAALTVADAAAPAATAVGAANTLVRRPDGSWFADNTDIPGMVRVLRDAGVADRPSVSVLGGGGTARAALAAAAALGAASVTVVTRRAAALDALQPAATALGLTLDRVDWSDAITAFTADAIISTVPKGAADDLATAVPWSTVGAGTRPGSVGGAGTRPGIAERPFRVLFDAVYDPWPTPLAAAAAAAGVRVASGLDLLLAQALGQFELFTGEARAPEVPMREALRAAAALR